MAQTHKRDLLDRGDMVGVPENIVSGLVSLWSGETLLLSAVSPNLNNLSKVCTDVTYKFYEEAWRPMRTTLNGAISSTTATSFTLTDQAAKPGDIIKVGTETVKLGTTSDYLTFAGCTRSVGTGSAATHADGASVLVLGQGHIEGEAFGSGDMIVQPDEITNYCQIFKREVEVSKTALVIGEYHRNANRYDAARLQQEKNLMHEVENSLIMGAAQARSGVVTEGTAQGIYERIQSTSSTNMSSGDMTLAALEAAIEASVDYGGLKAGGILAVPLRQKYLLDQWDIPRQRVDGGGGSVYGANLQVVSILGVDLRLLPMPKLKSDALLITPDFIRVGPLNGREFEHEYMGSDGDRVRGHIVGEYTFEIACPRAHHYFYGLATS